MKERAYLPNKLKKTIEEEKLDAWKWVKQAIKLGLLVEQGEIYRKIGDDYRKLRMKDIRPYPTPSGIGHPDLVEVIEIPREVTTEVRRTSQFRFREWFNRALTLRLMAENLNLLAREDDKFFQLSFE